MLLSRAASPSLAVIAVTVKIQIGRMTMIDLGDGEEVVWGRFGNNEPQIQIQHLGNPTKHRYADWLTSLTSLKKNNS